MENCRKAPKDLMGLWQRTVITSVSRCVCVCVCVCVCESVIMKSHSEGLRACGCFLISPGAHWNISSANVWAFFFFWHSISLGVCVCVCVCVCVWMSSLITVLLQLLQSVIVCVCMCVCVAVASVHKLLTDTGLIHQLYSGLSHRSVTLCNSPLKSLW